MKDIVMRRLGFITRHQWIFSHRLFGNSVQAPEAIKAMLAADESEQKRRELGVDTRAVVFACGSSADHRPRIAAAEAFDIAAAALPRAPNLCVMHISLDYAGMIDAPEVVWFNLCRANGVTPSTVRPQQLHMMGGAVRHQRVGGGYIQLLLGCVPDLETDVFTFDAIPEPNELDGSGTSGRPPPVLGIAFVDNQLALQHERPLAARMQMLADRLGAAPLLGGVYPPTQPSTSGSNAEGALGDSICFIHDRVYTGSAAGVVLRSANMRAHRVSIVPSISVGSATVTAMQSVDGGFVLSSLNGRRATDVIRDAYAAPDLCHGASKVFLGWRHNGVCVPIAFTGRPETGDLHFTAPSGVRVASGDVVELLVDDVELDTEAAAAELIGLQKQLSILNVVKDINVAREARRSVVVASAAALHFSHGGMNVLARPEVNLTLGNAAAVFAPSVLQRCVGQHCPTAGAFCPGQILSVGGAAGVFARSSTYCVLEGLR